MKVGTKVKWETNGGRNGGQKTQSGEVVAKVKAGDDAKDVFKTKIKDVKIGAFRINTSQLTSEHDRVIVKIADNNYVAPRADKVVAVES